MAESAKGSDILKVLRDARDGVMESGAKLVLGITSSRGYQRVQSLVVKPTLLWMSLYRRATERAMSGALAQLNMPSREEVLSLSQRLTHIEMALDDMGASLEQVRRAAQAQPRRQPQRTAARDTDLDSEPRPAARARNAGSETRATLSAKEA